MFIEKTPIDQPDLTRDGKPTCPRCGRGVLEPTEVTSSSGQKKVVLACDECPYTEESTL